MDCCQPRECPTELEEVEMAPGVRVEIADLHKRYGSVRALRGISFSTGNGWRCLGVLGRNGVGKTTLLRVLVGLLQADHGRIEVEVDGTAWSHAGPRIAAFVGEQTTVVPTITGWQYFRLHADMNRLLGIGVNAGVRDEMVQHFLLAEHLGKPAGKMSKGNRRKTEVVAALASEVPLLVADELTDGLDVPSRMALEQVLQEAAKYEKHFIVSSHDLSFVRSVCDTVAVIDGGRCVDWFAMSADEPSFRSRVARAFELVAADSPPVPDAASA